MPINVTLVFQIYLRLHVDFRGKYGELPMVHCHGRDKQLDGPTSADNRKTSTHQCKVIAVGIGRIDVLVREIFSTFAPANMMSVRPSN